jgi:hypothetical protein
VGFEPTVGGKPDSGLANRQRAIYHPSSPYATSCVSRLISSSYLHGHSSKFIVTGVKIGVKPHNWRHTGVIHTGVIPRVCWSDVHGIAPWTCQRPHHRDHAGRCCPHRRYHLHVTSVVLDAHALVPRLGGACDQSERLQWLRCRHVPPYQSRRACAALVRCRRLCDDGKVEAHPQRVVPSDVAGEFKCACWVRLCEGIVLRAGVPRFLLLDFKELRFVALVFGGIRC